VVEKDFSASNKWVELMEELGLNESQFEEFDKFFDSFDDINLTRDIETLKPLIEEKFKVKLPEGYSLLTDGFIKRFEVNKSIWPVIDGMHKSCKVGLLTNMYPGMFSEIEKSGIMPAVVWNEIIDSSVVGFEKPDPEIFKIAEFNAGAKGTEILFVENSARHVDAAKKFGWNTFLYDSSDPEGSSKDLLEFFNKLNEL